MDLSMVLTVVGLVVTIIFGFLSIDLFKKKKYPGKLTLINHSSIGLFNNIAKNFSEISIQYKGEAIKENVIYIKGAIINEGHIDIDGSNVEKTVKLTLGSELKWIKAKVTEISPELICGTEIKNEQSDLLFNIGLIRKKEFFQFEALIETTNNDQTASDIYNNVSISHRIANTQKITTTTLLNEEQLNKKKKRRNRIYFISATYFVASIVLLVSLIYITPRQIKYESTDGKVYSIKAISDDKIRLTDMKTDNELVFFIEEFQMSKEYRMIVEDINIVEEIGLIFYLIGFTVILFTLGVIIEQLELRKNKKLHDIFNTDKSK